MSRPNWVPQSPRWLARITSCPRCTRILTIASPTTVVRRWPTCISLETLGDEEAARLGQAGGLAGDPIVAQGEVDESWPAHVDLAADVLQIEVARDLGRHLA